MKLREAVAALAALAQDTRLHVFRLLVQQGATGLAAGAIASALAVLRRPVEPGQYAAGEYRKVLAARGIMVSMSRKGDCWDNAPMESANGTVKVECVHGVHFETRAEAAQALVEYFGYYNTERLHSSLGYLSPSEFERRWRAENEHGRTTP